MLDENTFFLFYKYGGKKIPEIFFSGNKKKKYFIFPQQTEKKKNF